MDERSRFFHLLHELVVTGKVPFAEALEVCARETDSVELGGPIGVLHRRVVEGSELSSALADFPEIFPRFVVKIVRAAEHRGTLDHALALIGSALEEAPGTREQEVVRGLGRASALLELGIGFSESLPIAAEAASLDEVRRALAELGKELSSAAAPFASLLAKHDCIPELVRALVEAAEPPGLVDAALAKLAALEREGLLYPASERLELVHAFAALSLLMGHGVPFGRALGALALGRSDLRDAFAEAVREQESGNGIAAVLERRLGLRSLALIVHNQAEQDGSPERTFLALARGLRRGVFRLS